jgi:hypothetical protein
MRLRLAPGMAPAATAPPTVMINSDGTGMQADSATMSKNTATYPYVAMRRCIGPCLR